MTDGKCYFYFVRKLGKKMTEGVEEVKNYPILDDVISERSLLDNESLIL